jgi:hypothetical protein
MDVSEVLIDKALGREPKEVEAARRLQSQLDARRPREQHGRFR